MPVIDLRNGGGGRPAGELACDVCIVGSGPAGSTLARELSNTNIRIIILESGGFTRDAQADDLNEVQSIGRERVADQWEVRNRIVGGSSHTWGGRCAIFDDIDFEARSWVPASGWPFKRDELSQYWQRAAVHLGLAVGDGFCDQGFWDIAGCRPPQTEPQPEYLLPFFWQFSRDDAEAYPYEYMRFGRHLVAHLGPNATLIAGATVVCINPAPSGHAVESVTYAAPDGQRHTLRASKVVLCTGGIENARVLLASNQVVSGGLGNDRDLVGRYLMDHMRGSVGWFDTEDAARVLNRYGRYHVRDRLFRAGLRLSPEVQRREGLLNCAAWIAETLSPDDPWETAKRAVKGRIKLGRDTKVLFANLPLFVSGLWNVLVKGTGIPRKLQKLTLDCIVEQRPDRDSRVMLSERRDRFGVPLPCIDWRAHEEEAQTLRRTAELVAESFGRMGLPVPQLYSWIRDGGPLPPAFKDIAHPTGSTRMSDDPASGVVDADCQVHGVKGLYVSGSSVFPTAGHCNPTMMIVGMAVRLADHLRASHRL